MCNTSGKNGRGKGRKKGRQKTGKEGKTERKKKRVGNKYLDKRNYCVGTEPNEYIGILVTSTITGHGGSVVSALDPQAKGRVHIPIVTTVFP